MITLKSEVKGWYKFIVGVPGEEPRISTDWIENLITDGGLDRLGTGVCCTHCSVGTGNTAPANTDAALVAFHASTSTITSTLNSAAGAAPYYGEMQLTYVFAQGAVVGNMAEVGVGWAAGGGSLFSRALISPTITVLALEVLTVIYMVRKYAPTADVTGSVTIAGVARTFTLRAANATSGNTAEGWGGLLLSTSGGANAGGVALRNEASRTGIAYGAAATLGAVTGIPVGASSSNFSGGSATNGAYVSGSYQKDGTLVAGISEVNTPGGIGAVVVFHSCGAYQCSFSPVIEKDNTKTMSLTFRFSWARRP